MLRILHLITRLPIGGAERLILGVLRNLDPATFESVVCCIQDRGELAGVVEALGVPVLCLGFMQRGGYDRRVVPALRRIMRDHRIDVVHTHLYHANLYGRLAARRERIPAIASVHNTYARSKWHRRLINRYLARYSYAITASSVDVEKDVLELDRVPKRKLIRMPNAIDLSRVQTDLAPAQAKKRLGFVATDRVIATVGRVEEQKGHAFLLEAFALLRRRPGGESLRLLIVGDGRLLPDLRALAVRMGLDDVSRFPGQISQLADVYRAMDVFVMPSLWEGLSLAMLEAMAAGLPVVATEVGGARDVLGDSEWGLLVPPGDARALADAMARLLTDVQTRQDFATRGAERVRKHYSVATLAAQLANLYRAASQSR
jgi:glycosyltransferase involved in cell wall biosynthesis